MANRYESEISSISPHDTGGGGSSFETSKHPGHQPAITGVHLSSDRFGPRQELPQLQHSGKENERNVVSPVVGFPEDPVERREAVMVSTNIGPKAMTIHLLPPDGAMRPVPDLKNDFAGRFAGTDIATPNGMLKQPGAFSKNSFVPHGLVAQEFSVRGASTDHIVGYGLTPAGQRYGIPGASAAIGFEVAHGIPLYPILGSINKNPDDSHSAPHNRATVLQTLASLPPGMRAHDVNEQVGLVDKTFRETVANLEQMGLVTYEASSGRIGRERVLYKRGDADPHDVIRAYEDRTYGGLVIDAITALESDGQPVSVEAVYDQLPQEVRERSDPLRGRHRVGNHMKHLLSDGALEHTGQRRGEQSSLTITDAGMAVVTEYINVVDGIVNDDPEAHAAMAEQTTLIREDPTKYAQAVGELYRPYSKYAVTQERETIMAGVGTAIAAHPDGVTVANLAESAGIPPTKLNNYLRIMEKRGRIEWAIVRGARMVRIINEE